MRVPIALRQAFKTAVQSAINFFQNTFNDPITANIGFGWGEIGGYSIPGAVAAVPEPGSLSVLVAAMLGVAGLRGGRALQRVRSDRLRQILRCEA